MASSVQMKGGSRGSLVDNLTALNQTFFAVAIFFSSLFFWQLLAALAGLGGGGGADSGDAALDDAGPEIDDGIRDASVAAFKLLSVRSIIAFGMLFGWAGALYLNSGTEVENVLLYSLVWGAAAMVAVAYFYHGIQQLSETANPDLATCVGTSGEVYMDIPKNGTGQIRVTESGAVTYVSARTVDEATIPHNTPVRVLRVIDGTTLEVEQIEP